MDYQLTMLGISLPQLSGCFPNARYMVLYREDLLQQYLSWKCASHLWLWYMRRGKCYRQTPDQLPPLQISLSELTSFCQEHLHFYRNLQAWEKIGGRVIWCRYEDLVEDPQLVCNRLFEFLGFSAVHVSTQLIKMINRKPREMISNFEEVAPLISNETTKLKLDPTPLSAASASTRRRAPHNSQLLNGLQL
ncbi:MAG: sulfotransferase domain-containing protein [Oligoflexia bacterium]|nr:sulfotransferase domain-containing protein [Oligoflexia bacterium]